jgi:hypothetical protein
MGTIAARLGDENSHVRAAACSFFGTCSESERAPHMGTIAARLSDKNPDVRAAAWWFFGKVSESERAPHMGAIAARLRLSLCDGGSDEWDAAWWFLDTCSESERALHMGTIAELLSAESGRVSGMASSFFMACSSLEFVPYLPDLVGLLELGDPKIRDAALSLLQKDPSLFQRVLDALSSDGARRALADRQVVNDRTMLHILAMATDRASAEWRAATCEALAPWTSSDLVDDAGRTAFDVGLASPCLPVKRFFERFGTLLGRYRMNPGLDEHTSATSVVKFACDLAAASQDQRVALKFIKSERHFVHELNARAAADGDLDGIVSRVRGWHCPLEWHLPAGLDLPPSLSSCGRDETTDPCDEYAFVLVLERCDVSAHAYVSKQRIAGFKEEWWTRHGRIEAVHRARLQPIT